MSSTNTSISIVIPIHNEAASILPLFTKIQQEIKKLHLARWEVIFVDDASTDNSLNILRVLARKYKSVHCIHFFSQQKKALALQAGFEKASNKVIITMDGDLQDDPTEIPRLLATLDTGYDLVSGWKMNRNDPFIKVVTSKVFNTVTSLVTGVAMQDMNSGIKAYKREVLDYITLYGELHRFIPVFARYHGFKIAEIPVKHHKRVHGSTKYGPLRFIHGFLDLITVSYLTKYRFQPLHLFGYISLSIFSLGFLISLYLTYVKYTTGQSIGDRPLLLLAVLFMIIGVQMGVVGLIAEHITSTHISRTTTDTFIRKKEY